MRVCVLSALGVVLLAVVLDIDRLPDEDCRQKREDERLKESDEYFQEIDCHTSKHGSQTNRDIPRPDAVHSLSCR